MPFKIKSLERLLEKREITADGVPFCDLDVVFDRVQPVFKDGVIVEYRANWKQSKRLKAIMDGKTQLCGAVFDDHACRARVVIRADGKPGKRCRFHGGLSSGPRTAAGRAAIAESNRRRHKVRTEMAT